MIRNQARASNESIEASLFPPVPRSFDLSETFNVREGRTFPREATIKGGGGAGDGDERRPTAGRNGGGRGVAARSFRDFSLPLYPSTYPFQSPRFVSKTGVAYRANGIDLSRFIASPPSPRPAARPYPPSALPCSVTFS